MNSQLGNGYRHIHSSLTWTSHEQRGKSCPAQHKSLAIYLPIPRPSMYLNCRLSQPLLKLGGRWAVVARQHQTLCVCLSESTSFIRTAFQHPQPVVYVQSWSRGVVSSSNLPPPPRKQPTLRLRHTLLILSLSDIQCLLSHTHTHTRYTTTTTLLHRVQQPGPHPALTCHSTCR